MEQHHLPAQWTPIARRIAHCRWDFADGWTQTLVDELRDAGRLLTAWQTAPDRTVRLLAHATRGGRR